MLITNILDSYVGKSLLKFNKKDPRTTSLKGLLCPLQLKVTKAYLELWQTSKVDRFVKIVNGF